MRNVSVPFGAPYGEFGVYNTEYRTVSDLTNRTYYFELTISPSTIWVNFDTVALADGGESVAIDPYDDTLTGDVSARFAPRQVDF
jgi:penicillin V acylase-like amidase (Ntn superfamily)